VAAEFRALTHPELRLRVLERSDLRFIHDQVNTRSVMTYWFEEPYESFDELEDLYSRHIHDNTERRFVVETSSEKTSSTDEWRVRFRSEHPTLSIEVQRRNNAAPWLALSSAGARRTTRLSNVMRHNP
jgi:RimJ/RimL family protein N-acetyltransferase